MGTVDDESRTRTNCSFVREKRNFVVRRGNSARSESNLLLPRSRAAFSETRIRKGPRGRGGSELSSVHRPGQRGSGKSTGGRSLTKFFRRNRSSTHASVRAHTFRDDLVEIIFPVSLITSLRQRDVIQFRDEPQKLREKARFETTIAGDLIYLEPETNRNICSIDSSSEVVGRRIDHIFGRTRQLYQRRRIVGSSNESPRSVPLLEYRNNRTLFNSSRRRRKSFVVATRELRRLFLRT